MPARKRGRRPRVSGWSCSESRFNKSRQSYDACVRRARGGKVVKHTYTQFPVATERPPAAGGLTAQRKVATSLSWIR